MKIEALYLDMDGVLADFDAALRARGVVDDQPLFHHKPKDEWTDAQLELDRKVRECMESEDFWPSIPVMKDARELWAYTTTNFNTYVLTATPRETAHRGRITQQKRDWIKRHFGPSPDFRTIVCERAQKREWAGPGRVLVDDLTPNCKEWFEAGGIAIRHISAKSSIQQLASLMRFESPQSKLALRDKTSAERKGEPIHSGVMLYFPDALAAVARISKAGNAKHNPGEPLHWARGKSMDQMDAAARHMLTLEAIDTESNETEAAHNAWRALAQLQLIEEKRLTAAGVKPYSGIVP